MINSLRDEFALLSRNDKISRHVKQLIVAPLIFACQSRLAVRGFHFNSREIIKERGDSVARIVAAAFTSFIVSNGINSSGYLGEQLFVRRHSRCKVFSKLRD